ncbi:MAG: acetylornithine deacetylase [Planctomycetota bacterium]
MSKASLTPLEMLARLVAFDTTSSKSNLELIDFVCDHLEGLGWRVALTRDDEGMKANIWATAGPDDLPGLVLSGHTDVVPVTGQPWTCDPFRLTEKEDCVFGRGTTDMKGFIALALSEIGSLDIRRLEAPIHLALTYDEEVGCHGARRLLSALPTDRPKPELVLVGEPTSLGVVVSHKGLQAYETRIEGRAAHSSRPDLGCSAVRIGAEIVRFLEELAESRRASAEPGEFEPPYTTVNVGRIDGGTAINIIPRECRLVWEYRPLPGERPSEIREQVDAFIAEKLPADENGLPRIETRTLAEVPAFPAQKSSPAVAFAKSVLGEESERTVSYTSEAGLFQAAGVPAVVCGPGDVAQAHQPDEFLSLEQLAAGGRMIREALRRYVTPPG